MNELRFVLDSNVLVSAALFKGSISRQAFNKAAVDGQILMSEAVLAELQDVFNRPRFDRYSSSELRAAFLTDLLMVVEQVEITETVSVCRDPKDNKFLELAVSGQATCILSSDKDLLVLNPFQEITILTPADFLADS
jgi:uncharacterized protein